MTTFAITWIFAGIFVSLACNCFVHVASYGLNTQVTKRGGATAKITPFSRFAMFSSFPTTQDESNQLQRQELTLMATTTTTTTTTKTSTNSTAKLVEEAEFFRARAKQLKAEAKALEASLTDNRYTQRKMQISVLDDMIGLIATSYDDEGNGTTISMKMADTIRNERWSPEQVLKVMNRLHERQSDAKNTRSKVHGKSTFQIGDTRNAAANETEWFRLDRLVDGLIQAASILDEEAATTIGQLASSSAVDNTNNSNANNNINQVIRWGKGGGRVANSLKSRIKELRRTDEQAFQRKLAAHVASSDTMNSNMSVEAYVRKTLGLPTIVEETEPSKRVFNLTRVMEKVALVPRWVPSSLLPFILAAKTKLDSSDVNVIKDKVLMGSKFYCTSTESIPTAALFRGNVRGTNTAVGKGGILNATELRMITSSAFDDVQTRLEAQTEIAARVQLFFLQDPDWRPTQDERDLIPFPVILALPKTVVPDEGLLKQQGKLEKWGKRACGALALFCTLLYSVACFALNPTFFDSVLNKQDVSVLMSSLPVFIGVVAVQAIHEGAHYLVAKARGISIGAPIPIPSLEIGTFGCITPLRSFPSTRSALLDFALSGPVASMILSIALMIFGIHATVHASGLELAQFPVIPVALLKSSCLTGTLLTYLAPKTMLLPITQPIPVHPCFMIGFSGLLSSALNLLPIFRLDGGRASAAVFGPRFSGIASAFTLLMMLSLALSGSNIAFSWGMLVLFFQRRPEIPVRDEVTGVDDIRLGAWLASLVAAIIALVPFPGSTGIL